MLNIKENIEANDFMILHGKKHKKDAAAILEVRATEVGYHVKITCPYCKKSKDISDYDSW